MLIFHFFLMCLFCSHVLSQLLPGTFSGDPGTGSGGVREETQVGFLCDVRQEVALIQISVKISGSKTVVAERANDTTLSLSFHINRTLHNARFSCKAFWSNQSEAYKSGEKWYNVEFAVTEITLTTSVSSTDHVFEEVQTLLVTCTCNEGHPTPEIIWTRDGEALQPEYEEVKQLIDRGENDYDRVSSTLTLTTQPFMNRAMYVCHVRDNQQLQQNYTLEVLFLAEWSRLEVTPADPVREDQWLSVTCSVSPSNPVTRIDWYLGGSPVSQATPTTELGTSVTGDERYHAKGLQNTLRIQASEERVGALVECRVFYQNKEIFSLSKSHTLQVKTLSDVYIYAGAAAGVTITLGLLTTLLILLCQRRKRRLKSKVKANPTPEDSYEYIIDGFNGDKNTDKPSAQNVDMTIHATTNDHDMEVSRWNQQLSSVEQLSLTSLLKEGHYSTVMTASPKQHHVLGSRQYVAAKILRAHPKSYMRDLLLTQLHALQRVKTHANLVQLLAFVENKKELVIVNEYYECGDLQTFLRSRDLHSQLTSRHLIGMALDVAKAMRFLSSHTLSGSHVLVGPSMLCKVTGFTTQEGVQHREQLQRKHKMAVDIRWRAPELMRQTSTHTVHSDVWAFGVLLYEITTFGSLPYPGLSTEDVRTFVSSGECMARPGFVSANIYALMKACWSWQTYKRPSFAYLVSQLEVLRSDPCEHVDVIGAFRPQISAHMHAGNRRH